MIRHFLLPTKQGMTVSARLGENTVIGSILRWYDVQALFPSWDSYDHSAVVIARMPHGLEQLSVCLGRTSVVELVQFADQDWHEVGEILRTGSGDAYNFFQDCIEGMHTFSRPFQYYELAGMEAFRKFLREDLRLHSQ